MDIYKGRVIRTEVKLDLGMPSPKKNHLAVKCLVWMGASKLSRPYGLI